MIVVVAAWVLVVASPLVGACLVARMRRHVWATQDAIEAADFPPSQLHPKGNP